MNIHNETVAPITFSKSDYGNDANMLINTLHMVSGEHSRIGLTHRDIVVSAFEGPY